MAKKFVRGITDVKTINNQDFDTNNVNDLLSDGQYNYIHRKKGKNEEYHNLTDNIKTISSDNTELLAVTNYNKTTNTATLHPKHDAQKEQVLESARDTVNIHHGTNATAEKTTVDTNPLKVLEHENLQTTYGISKDTTGNITTLGLEYTKVEDGFDLNNLSNGKVRSNKFVNSPQDGWMFVSTYTEGSYSIQRAIALDEPNNKVWVRRRRSGTWEAWREQVGDKSVIDELIAQKEQVLESTRNTVTINHGTNATAEKTTVDTNPQKVLEHENLKTGDGLTTSFNTDETTIMFKATKKEPSTSLKNLGEGIVWGSGFSDGVIYEPANTPGSYITIRTDANAKVQLYIRESTNDYAKIRLYYRFIKNGEGTEWKQMVGDIDELNHQLAQKQNKLTAGDGISITGDSISLTSLNDYSEDLNNLTYTCTAKPIDNTPNLPTGVGGNGVLSVIRVGNVVSQTYHALDNNVYYRITNNSSTTFVWTSWVKVTTAAV